MVSNGNSRKITSLEPFFLQAGIITFNTSIIKGGVEKFALKQPIFLVCSTVLCRLCNY